jgi:leucyl-tRNA synthetase
VPDEDDDRTAGPDPVRPGDDEPVTAEVRFEKMSKRKGNVVNPDDVIALYGADALRVYLCFLTPLESDKPWQTSQLEAQHDWLKRVWRLFFEGDDDAPRATDDAADEDELRVLHKAVKTRSPATSRRSEPQHGHLRAARRHARPRPQRLPRSARCSSPSRSSWRPSRPTSRRSSGRAARATR